MIHRTLHITVSNLFVIKIRIAWSFLSHPLNDNAIPLEIPHVLITLVIELSINNQYEILQIVLRFLKKVISTPKKLHSHDCQTQRLGKFYLVHTHSSSDFLFSPSQSNYKL